MAKAVMGISKLNLNVDIVDANCAVSTSDSIYIFPFYFFAH